jgi:hypothetical protein
VSKRKYGVTTYYIGEESGFDEAIAQLMPQVRDGLAVNICRLDGIQARVSSYTPHPGAPAAEPYWMRREAIHCDMCVTAWKPGYVGIDAAGTVKVSICYDCSDVLLRLQLGVTRLVMS